MLMECQSSVKQDVWGVSIECLSSVDQRYPSRVSINTHSELTVDAFSTYDPLLIMTIIMITYSNNNDDSISVSMFSTPP